MPVHSGVHCTAKPATLYDETMPVHGGVYYTAKPATLYAETCLCMVLCIVWQSLPHCLLCSKALLPAGAFLIC